MARINKNSRLKGLPPKIQLFESDSVSSQGNNSIPWSDQNTIVFNERQDVNYGSKLDASSQFLTSELSSSLSSTGKIIAGVSDTWTIQSGLSSRLTTTLEPYKDSGNPAVDGLSNEDSFFSSGNTEGFTQPLWSKKKIEIDIGSKPCSFKMVISQSNNINTVAGTPPTYDNGTAPGYVSGSSYPMAYYNFDTKMWEGIGTGYALQSNNITRGAKAGDGILSQNMAWQDAVEFLTVGFCPGILNLKAQITNALTSSTPQQVDYAEHFLSLDPPRKDIVNQKLAGHVTDNYGFPYAAKFHATSSQLLNMSDYISQPFLLEKIVLDISGAQFTMFDSVDPGGYYSLTSSVLPAVVNNFFVLNQRRNSSYTFRPENYNDSVANSLQFTIPRQQRLTAGASETYVNTVRDLVTYGGITSYTNDIADRQTEVIPFFTDLTQISAKQAALAAQTAGAEVGCPLFGVYTTATSTAALTSSFDILGNISRDLNIYVSSSISSSLAEMSWTSNIKANIPVVSFNRTNFFDTNSILSLGNTSNISSFWNGFEGGTNGLSFRSFVNRRQKSDLGSVAFIDAGGSADVGVSSLFEQRFAKDFSKKSDFVGNIMFKEKPLIYENPYLLLPTDQLVFGWQLPTPQYISDFASMIAPVISRGHHNVWGAMSIPPTATGLNGLMDICQMSFNGPGKVIFYGSYISEDTEDTEMTSDVVVTSAISKPIGES